MSEEIDKYLERSTTAWPPIEKDVEFEHPADPSRGVTAGYILKTDANRIVKALESEFKEAKVMIWKDGGDEFPCWRLYINDDDIGCYGNDKIELLLKEIKEELLTPEK